MYKVENLPTKSYTVLVGNVCIIYIYFCINKCNCLVKLLVHIYRHHPQRLLENKSFDRNLLSDKLKLTSDMAPSKAKLPAAECRIIKCYGPS